MFFVFIATSSDSSCSESDSNDDECEDNAYEELQRKKTHPWRLHEEMWYNDPGEVCFLYLY
jgi:ribonuclease-3